MSVDVDEMVQSYFEKLYKPFDEAIHRSRASGHNETYGEIYYLSASYLLKTLQINEKDHFLDIGSGVGKVIFQAFLTTNAHKVTGIEINEARHKTASAVELCIREELPALFENNRSLLVIQGDFLKSQLSEEITVVYVCSTVFSFELLDAMGKKINTMPNVRMVVSFRKLPHLRQFTLEQKLFLHCSWDKVPCYIYVRKLSEENVSELRSTSCST